MPLHRDTKRFQFERLVYYFVRPGSGPDRGVVAARRVAKRESENMRAAKDGEKRSRIGRMTKLNHLIQRQLVYQFVSCLWLSADPADARKTSS